MAKSYLSRLASKARTAKLAGGILPGSMDNRILLALRGAPMLQEQMSERFGTPTHSLARLERMGLITKPGAGKKGEAIAITAAGRSLLDQQSSLSRRSTEIVYCQL